MAKKYDDDIGGVWRTIGGRRVFIKTGQSLSEAMVESGKFKNLRNTYQKDKVKQQEKQDKKEWEDKVRKLAEKNAKNKGYELPVEEPKEGISERDAKDLIKQLNDEGSDFMFGDAEIKDGKLVTDVSVMMPWEDGLETRTLEVPLDKNETYASLEEKMRDWEDRHRSVDDWNNPDFDEPQKDDIFSPKPEDWDDINHWYNDDPREEWDKQAREANWQDKIKANNDKLEKDLEAFKEKHKTDMTNERVQEEYYELFRKNERANAKIKAEHNEPDEKYVNVDAYAGYKEKFNDTWGEDGSGTQSVSAKMYTNDEFMEHLEDANWHSERRALIDANLTNKELEYIKDRTRVSAWGVDNLTGKEQVESLIKEAKEHSTKKPMSGSLDSDYISSIASATNSINDSYGYAFNEMLDSAKREGLKVKSIDIGNNGTNKARVEFEDGGNIDFYNLSEGKAFINKVSSDDFAKYEKALNSYRVNKTEDMSYDFNSGKWINNSENVRINKDNVINDKYDALYNPSVNDYYDSLPAYDVYNKADALARETKNYTLKDELIRKMRSVDRANKRGEGFSQKQTNELREILKGVENGNENQITAKLREKAYKKYLKEHPNSKITFEDFMRK